MEMLYRLSYRGMATKGYTPVAVPAKSGLTVHPRAGARRAGYTNGASSMRTPRVGGG